MVLVLHDRACDDGEVSSGEFTQEIGHGVLFPPVVQETELCLEGAEEGVGKSDGDLLRNASHYSGEIIAKFNGSYVYILSILTLRQCVLYVFAVNTHIDKELVVQLITSQQLPEVRDCLSARNRDYLFPSKGTSPLGLFHLGADVPILLSPVREVLDVNVSTNLMGNQMVAAELEGVAILDDFQPFILRFTIPSGDFTDQRWVEELSILLGLFTVVPRVSTPDLE